MLSSKLFSPQTSSHDTPSLHVRLLGEFSLIYEGEVVQSVGALRLQSLLAYLVLHRAAPQSRRHLAFTLWPDSAESQARTNLRRELFNLRQIFPAVDRFLSIELQTLSWHDNMLVTLDVADFEQAITAAQQAEEATSESGIREALIQAVALYKGDLLPDCYDEWLLIERERLRQLYLEVLEQLIGLLHKHQDYRSAIKYAQLLLREDPLAEEAYLQLIRLHSANGDRARALRVYHTCVTTLKRELGVEPAPATRQAYETLLKADIPPNEQPPAQSPLIGTSSLIDREAEWQKLHACWHQAANGQSHFVAVTGEPGIGKTRLVEELVGWASRQGIATAQSRCYPSEGGLAYAPVSDWLQGAGLRRELLNLEDIWLTQVARLIPGLLAERPGLLPPKPLTESWQRNHYFEAMARAIFVNKRPQMLVIDDLHWIDQETLAWLHYLLRFTPQAPLLVVATIRLAELDAGHPLTSWLMDLRRSDQMSEIELGPLNEADTAVLAANIAGTELNADIAMQLYKETEGNPLFVIETVRAGEFKDTHGREMLLSPKLQAVIESRLAQLSSPARRTANLAAVIGRAFSFDVLAEASQESEDWLVHGLDELWHRHIIREQSDNDYDFSHNKIREAVYNSLSMANRRLLHRRIAGAMETVHAANLDNVSLQIANQYEAAGAREKAIAYYLRAGQVAQAVYANADAIQIYTKGLRLLETLPENTGRAEQELTLQRLLSIALRNVKGYAAAEVGQSLRRARTLCHQLDQTEVIGSILWGLFTFNFVRADLHQAHKLGEELFALGESLQSADFLQQAYYALGGTLCSLGEFETSLKHFEQGIALYELNQHQAHVAMYGVDLGVFCRAWSTLSLWHSGFLDQSLQEGYAAVALAEQLQHPFSRAVAMAYAAMVFQLNRDSKSVQKWASMTLNFCTEHGIGYYNHWATILHGWALVKQGFVAEGINQMREGISNFRASGSEIRLSYYLTLLAEAYGQAGQPQAGLEHLSEAMYFVEKNRDSWYSAESYRLMGDLYRQSGQSEQAEASYQQSLEIGRRQRTKTLTLRTAVSLARLWVEQGQHEQARMTVADIYNSFTEGFNTVDLKTARDFLAELA